MPTRPPVDLTTFDLPDIDGSEALAATFEVLPTSLAVLDANGRVSLTNQAWRAESEHAADRLAMLSVGDRVDDVRDAAGTEPDSGPTPTEEYLLEGVARVCERRSERFELHYCSPHDGEDRWFLFTASALPDRGAVLSRLETTAHEQVHEALADLAFHDALTGLPNRSLVSDRIGMTLGRTNRSGAWTAVVFADLDGFKQVNDSFGHLAGDRVLVQVAQRLRTVVRAEDTCGRWGGDEFVLVMELADAQAVEAIAARIRLVLTPPVEVDGHAVRLGASLGVALASRLYPVDELLRLADDAMYTAKRDGTGLHIVTAGR